MKRMFLLLVLCLGLSGCSLLPKINFGTSGTTPQVTTKSGQTIKCSGTLHISPDGTEITCSKGFYQKTDNYSQKERKYTFFEGIGNFLDKAKVYGIIIVIVGCFLCPGFLGFLLGRFVTGIWGIGTKAFKQVVSAIQKVKTTTPELRDALEKSTDEDVRAFIKKFKEQNNIK